MKIKIAGQQIEDGFPTLEQWAAWGKVPGLMPGRRAGSMVPEALRDVPEFAVLEQVRQRLLESEKLDRDRVAAIDARNQERVREHRLQLEAHTLQGLEPPARPELEEWHGMEFAMEFFTRHHVILEAVERELLRERADDWRDHIRKKARANHVKKAKAEQALAEAQELMQPFDEARKAVDSAVARAGRRSTFRPTIDVGEKETDAPAAGAMDDNPESVEVTLGIAGEPPGMTRRRLADQVPAEVQEIEEGLLDQRIAGGRLTGRR